jgi:crotonobetaine/carnitine-CoA ligase
MSHAANLPARADCVVRELLIARAARDPDRPLILFENDETWSAAAALGQARQYAAGFAALGVKPGDPVLSWQGNGPLAVTTFLALNFLGAIYVPINTGYRGALLEHVLGNSGARLLVADGRLIDRLAGVDTALVERIIVSGDERLLLPGVELIPATALTSAGDEPPLALIEPTDTHMVIYTSGTTGPSKGVLSSYIHSYTAATGFRNIGPGDRSLMQLPMFHVGGPYAILWALIHGGSTVVVEAFSVTRFWDIVRRFDVTTVGLLGSMTQFLMKQPESPDDRRHPLRGPWSLRLSMRAPSPSAGVSACRHSRNST